MKTLGVLTLVVALTALTAQAGILPGGEMKATVQADGSVTLTNITGAAISVDGYELWSLGGNLDPVGWASIADQAGTDPIGTLTALGAGALSFGELTAGAGLLAEASLSSAALFQPAADFAIGIPVATVAGGADIAFYYTKPTAPGDKFIGVVEVIPEPATMAVLALGGLVALRRRR